MFFFLFLSKPEGTFNGYNISYTETWVSSFTASKYPTDYVFKSFLSLIFQRSVPAHRNQVTRRYFHRRFSDASGTNIIGVISDTSKEIPVGTAVDSRLVFLES